MTALTSAAPATPLKKGAFIQTRALRRLTACAPPGGGLAPSSTSWPTSLSLSPPCCAGSCTPTSIQFSTAQLLQVSEAWRSQNPGTAGLLCRGQRGSWTCAGYGPACCRGGSADAERLSERTWWERSAHRNLLVILKVRLFFGQTGGKRCWLRIRIVVVANHFLQSQTCTSRSKARVCNQLRDAVSARHGVT